MNSLNSIIECCHTKFMTVDTDHLNESSYFILFSSRRNPTLWCDVMDLILINIFIKRKPKFLDENEFNSRNLKC
jgi:hypothetical protein